MNTETLVAERKMTINVKPSNQEMRRTMLEEPSDIESQVLMIVLADIALA